MTNQSINQEAIDCSLPSAKSEKNRSSAPLKNRVGHTMLVGSAIVKLVGLVIVSLLERARGCRLPSGNRVLPRGVYCNQRPLLFAAAIRSAAVSLLLKMINRCYFAVAAATFAADGSIDQLIVNQRVLIRLLSSAGATVSLPLLPFCCCCFRLLKL